MRSPDALLSCGFAALLLAFAAAPAHATLLGATVEGCAFNYSGCVSSFAPGTNSGGTFDPFDGDTTVTAGPDFEFQFLTGGAGRSRAFFDDTSLRLTLSNTSVANSTVPAGLGWVFRFPGLTILDIEVQPGRTALIDSAEIIGGNSIGVQFSTQTLSGFSTREVNLDIVATPEPSTAMLIGLGLWATATCRRRPREAPPRR